MKRRTENPAIMEVAWKVFEGGMSVMDLLRADLTGIEVCYIVSLVHEIRADVEEWLIDEEDKDKYLYEVYSEEYELELDMEEVYSYRKDYFGSFNSEEYSYEYYDQLD